MRHLSEGQLRAFYDGGSSAAERDEVQRHLETCARCAERASAVRERGLRVHALLAELEPQAGMDAVPPRLARSRLEAHLKLKEGKERSMARNPFARRYRAAWAVAVLLLLVTVTLTVPPVRTLAGNLLGLFRVQRIEFTPVDEEALPDEETLEAVAPEIERMFDETLAITMEGETETLDEAGARARAEFHVRLPAVAEDPVRYEWTPPVHIAMQVDLPRLRALFAELGYQDVDLPRALDGQTVEAQFEGLLTAMYGACDDESPTGQDCMVFVQMPSPTATAPQDLDVDRLGRVYLELLGVPDDEAARLSERVDWTTTLVVPLPHHVNLTHEMVRVDGVEGALIHSESGYRPSPEYLLTWIRGGVVYAVTGKGDPAAALELARSLE
jgi:anti-sigma factor RsiW